MLVTQIRLARIQQLQGDIAQLTEELKKEWSKLRKEILLGRRIEQGPIHAFLRKSGRRTTLVVK